jgi:hypothetical protein
MSSSRWWSDRSVVGGAGGVSHARAPGEHPALEGKKHRHAAANEAAIRDVNDGIEHGQWPGDEDATVGFRCERARVGFNQLIELTVREYEEIRSHPRRFVVVSGHELPDVETVVATRPGYFIVEERDQAGAVAEQADPRD